MIKTTKSKNTRQNLTSIAASLTFRVDFFNSASVLSLYPRPPHKIHLKNAMDNLITIPQNKKKAAKNGSASTQENHARPITIIQKTIP